MADKKEKRYVSDNAQLMAEWDWEKNSEIGVEPQRILQGSNKKAWWKCSDGHSWQAVIFTRTKGSGCPYCAGNLPIKGLNDLQTVNPILAEEWEQSLNGKLTPSDVLPQSGKKVWWKCKNGHTYQATIGNRSNGKGCPFCSSKRVIKGVNDLQTINPSLAAEWNYKLNGILVPTEVLPNSNKKVWWKCKNGHEWQAVISSRSRGCGCPICSSGLNTSFPEYAIIYYFQKCGIDVVHSFCDFGYELDIFIPSLRIGIEYDGHFWHKEKKKQDLEKNKKCIKDNITLYRIREELQPLNDSSKDFVVKKNHSNLSKIIQTVLYEITKTEIDVNIPRDFIDIENLRKHIELDQSLSSLYPSLAEEWNYELNGELLPSHVTPGSTKKVWWKCSKGHEWQAAVQARTAGGGCPYCSGKAVKAGYNDLATANPTLASEWNFEKNNDLVPSEVTANSGKKVWWKCKEGHEWKATISHRSNGTGCPYCSNKKVNKGVNDLQTTNPTLAAEWNYKLNGILIPSEILPNSNKKVWWKCSKGHEWQATVNHRTQGRGCPYCSSRALKKGFNDLLTVNPELAKEWNYERNSGMAPDDVTSSSGKKVWWKCAMGHEWESTINNRSKGKGCPECAKQKRKKSK